MPLTPEQRAAITHSNIKQADCSVIAIQAITGLPYEVAEKEALANNYGGGVREGNDEHAGMFRGDIERTLQSLGYKTKQLDTYGETPATFCLDHPKGTYLIYTYGHVGALIDGELLNVLRAEVNSQLETATEVTK